MIDARVRHTRDEVIITDHKFLLNDCLHVEVLIVITHLTLPKFGSTQCPKYDYVIKYVQMTEVITTRSMIPGIRKSIAAMNPLNYQINGFPWIHTTARRKGRLISLDSGRRLKLDTSAIRWLLHLTSIIC
jgi:hypothetical protein